MSDLTGLGVYPIWSTIKLALGPTGAPPGSSS